MIYTRAMLFFNHSATLIFLKNFDVGERRRGIGHRRRAVIKKAGSDVDSCLTADDGDGDSCLTAGDGDGRATAV